MGGCFFNLYTQRRRCYFFLSQGMFIQVIFNQFNAFWTPCAKFLDNPYRQYLIHCGIIFLTRGISNIMSEFMSLSYIALVSLLGIRSIKDNGKGSLVFLFFMFHTCTTSWPTKFKESLISCMSVAGRLCLRTVLNNNLSFVWQA